MNKILDMPRTANGNSVAFKRRSLLVLAPYLLTVSTTSEAARRSSRTVEVPILIPTPPDEFWMLLRPALLAGDEVALLALSRHPVVVWGATEADPLRRIAPKDLVTAVRSLLKEPAEGVPEGESNRQVIERIGAPLAPEPGVILLPSAVPTVGRIGGFGFAYFAEGWRLVRLHGISPRRRDVRGVSL